MPMNLADYHPDWKWISLQIREQADWHCEWCGIENATINSRGSTVVLTVAHIDHDKANNDPSNLAALCQKCHLTHDREHHMRNAAETRRRKRIAQGQMPMEAP